MLKKEMVELITENLSTLKIHKLTQNQYDRELANGNIDGDALYLTPDDNNGVIVNYGTSLDEAPTDVPNGTLFILISE